MLCISYGAMNIETLLGVVALVVVGSASVGKIQMEHSFTIFASSVAGFLEKLGISQHIAVCFMTMCIQH